MNATKPLIAPSDPQPPSLEQQAAGNFPPLLYDSSDLCHVLRCSKPTLHRLKAANKLPKALRLGGQLRWNVEEVQAWIRAGMPDGRTWGVLWTAEGGRS
jgi:excisionase family DNA binding protein